MKSTQNLPLRLKELRNQHHYSQEDLAEKLNVSRQAVSRWENGKAVPDIENILILAELYDVPVDELFDKDSCYVNDKSGIDNNKRANSVLEILVLSGILVLSSNLSFLGFIVAITILIWSIYTERQYKIVYILCILCIGINIYELFVFFVHFKTVYGNSFVIPR